MLLIVALGIVFALLAPLGMLTLPLAALIVFARPMPRRFRLTAVLATGISLGWLAGIGDPPDQVVRAAVVIGTTVFTITLVRSGWSLVHRSLLAILVAGAGVSGFMTVLGMSWPEVRWWVETKLDFSAQVSLSWLATANTSGNAMVVQLEDWFATAVPLMADFYPATTAVQMLAGFALATVVHQRMMYPKGQTLGRFRDFRFTEHLGWAAVFGLAAVLLTRLATIKVLAANVLIVTGVLYALRGAAVFWFAVSMTGGPGLVTIALIVFSILFMVPVVLVGTVLVGVVDAGLDLRPRWLASRART